MKWVIVQLGCHVCKVTGIEKFMPGHPFLRTEGPPPSSATAAQRPCTMYGVRGDPEPIVNAC